LEPDLTGVESELLDFQQLINKRREQYTGCHLQIALVAHSDGDWNLAVGKLIFHYGRSQVVPHLSYQSIRLFEEFCSIDDAISLIEYLGHYQEFEIGGTCVPVQGQFELKPSYWGYVEPGYWSSDGRAFETPWPTNISVYGPRTYKGPSLPHSALYGLDKPLYPNAEALLEERFGAKVVGSVFLGKLVLLIPNYSARFTGVSVGSGSMLVHVEALKTSLSNLVCKAYVDSAVPRQIKTELTSGSWTIPLAGRPQQWHLELFTRDDGELVDYRSHYGSPNAPAFSPEALDDETVRTLIAGGEDESIEFKLMPDKDPDRRKLIESVVALANSTGGVVLVGVADDGQVIGLFGDKLEETLSNLIADGTEPPVTCTIREVTIDNKKILVARIPASDNRPHLVKVGATGGVPYVRRGSTDRYPSRYELDEMYQK
jgi:hypothetical protein